MNTSRLISLAVAWSVTSIGALAQSIGIGGGMAIPASDVAQLPSGVRDGGWAEIEHRAERGYFIEVRGRLGSGLALVGGVSYNRFLDAESQYSDGSGRSVSLISSQAIVPISLGFERTLGDGLVVPFATVEGTASYFYRAYETRHGETPVPFDMQSSGEMRYGVALGLGSRLDIPFVQFDLVGRLHFVNLFGSASTTEDLVYFMQLGLSGYFGL
jgi:hypothetical protein